MRNQIYRVIAISALFVALTAADVLAQAPNKLLVKIPFAFTAGKVQFEPGVYSIKRISADNLTLRSVNNGSTLVLNAPVSLSSSNSDAVERLVFNKAGDQYVLSEIWLTADTGREIWKDTKLKKSERIEIALGRQK